MPPPRRPGQPAYQPTSFKDYLNHFSLYRQNPVVKRNMRLGQCYFNCLPGHMAARLSATKYDCSYSDHRIPQFLSHVEELFKEEARS